MIPESTASRAAHCLPGAIVNAAINGSIAWFEFRSEPVVPLSLDRIGSTDVTALGNAASLAFALVLIVTCITFFVFRRQARRSPLAPESLRQMPFLPTGLGIATANTLLAFGAFVTLAVLWQHAMGTILVSPPVAASVIAAIAAVATAFADLRTKAAMLLRAGVATW